MRTILIFLIMSSVFLVKSQWNWRASWVYGCDFFDRDFANARTNRNECPRRCAYTTGCTHFTWTLFNGGTCWMKYGSVSQSDSFMIDNQSAICGVVRWGGIN